MRNALIVLLILAAAAAGWYGGTQSAKPSSPEIAEEVATPPSVSRTSIRGIGKLEPHTGVLKIMAPIGQRIESIFDLEIGSSVNNEQAIVKLAGSDKAEIELQLALAKKADAEKKEAVEKSQGGLQQQAAVLALQEARAKRGEVESKGKGIELLDAQLATASDMLKNLQNLKSNPATSRLIGVADIEKQRLVVQQLETKISQSHEEVRLAGEAIGRAEAAAQLDIERIETMLGESVLPENSINTAIDAAQRALELLEIKSPISGTVLDIVVRPGDTATNQPVMLIGDTSRMVCVAEINDSSLAKVQVGAVATVTSSAIDEELTGKVISKGVMIGPPSMKDPNPFASVDRKTGRVVIELAESDLASKFVNLEVDVAIEPAEEAY